MSTGMAATDKTAHARSISFFDRARDGFLAFLNAASGTHSRVLLPAYIGWSPREGSGVFDPVLDSGLAYQFYSINDRFEPEQEVLDRLIDRGPAPIVLVIHYFGRRSPLTQHISRKVQGAGGLLVEDWAHGLFPHPATEPVGAAAIYALHKMLPMESGGVLLSTKDVRGTRQDVAASLLRYQTGEIAARRRQNYEASLEQLRAAELPAEVLRLPWGTLHQDDVPQSLPFYVRSEHKNGLYRKLNAEGVGVTSLYHTMIDEISHREYPRAHDMASSVLNLPIHQDVTPDDQMRLTASVIDALRSF